ncbi:MAG: stage II sporulation protein E (SpoIIE) [Bacteroidetes bacterium]|nr:MAG: stage II sporulation protein E (SpoIIE) [Bacteroidota bacterium]
MKIYTALQIGEYHQNYCEDYLFVGEIGSDKVLCAVMDGCTMATDSYFVATLVGKLLRKIAKQRIYKEFYDSELANISIENDLKSIIKELFEELNISKNYLMLEKKELMTTLILLLINKKKQKGVVLVVGDGLVNINGKITEFDQENTPDYLGFHLDKDFENWYNSQKQKIFFEEIHDLSIATDGIFMFSENKKDLTDSIDPIHFLLIDKNHEENEEMLSLKLKKLEMQFGIKPTDDLALIRIIC